MNSGYIAYGCWMVAKLSQIYAVIFPLGHGQPARNSFLRRILRSPRLGPRGLEKLTLRFRCCHDGCEFREKHEKKKHLKNL